MFKAMDGAGRPGASTVNQVARVPAGRPADGAVPWRSAPPAHRALAPRGRSVRAVVAVVLAGMLVGAGAGSLVGAGGAPDVEASALVQLSPDREPGLGAIGAGEETTESFTTTELAWLTGPGLRAATEERLAGAPVRSVSALRVGGSSVVEIAATGASPEEALRVVEAAVATYTERRVEQFRTSMDAAIASTEVALAELGGPDVVRSDLPTADQFRYDRLVSARSDLLLLRSSDPQPVQVIEEPNVVAQDGPGTGLLAAVLGAVLGGLLALGAHTAWRSRTELVLAPADALSVTGRILHPELRLPADWSTRMLQVLRRDDRQHARLLVGQIAHRGSLAARIIAVVGAGPDSGSRAVATLVAVGAADRASTLLVEVNAEDRHPLVATAAERSPAGRGAGAHPTDVDGLEIASFPRAEAGHGGRRRVDPRWAVAVEIALAERRCVVIDLRDMPELVRTLPPAAEVVLAVGVGVDSVPDASAVAVAVHGEQTGEPYAVVTRLPWRVRWAARLGRGRR